MSRFLDRRPHSRNKSAVNRERFMRRFKNQIQKAVSDAISNRSITNIQQGETISLPQKDICEPTFQHTTGGIRNIILPGNTHYVPGDKIKRSAQQSNSGDQQAGNSSSKEQDDFIFHLSKEEFLELYFQDLELPNLVKTEIHKTHTFKKVRSGFSSTGVPANMNLVRTMQGALARRIASKGNYQKKLSLLEKDLKRAKKNHNESEIKKLKKDIEKIKNRLKKIPFIDPVDVKYNQYTKQLQPATQAVMFCLMDVSGSMDEAKKDIAKRFFILLYLFLTKSYEKIELVFIRHHTSAKEVSEKEFFYSRETGGTVVSSALDLMQIIIQKRYLNQQWNIYGAQASDGDNWNNDSPKCQDLLQNQILPFVQYFAYIEIMPRNHQSLWDVYEKVKKTDAHFAMQTIRELKDIYPVLRNLFKKEVSKNL